MSHQKARVAAFAGVGATAGALLAGALISAAAASADVDVDGLHGNRTVDLTTQDNVDIFNNRGPDTVVNIDNPDADAVQSFSIYDDSRNTTTNITTAADTVGLTVENNDAGSTTTTDLTTTNTSVFQGSGYIEGNNVVATLEDNGGQTVTTITGSGPVGESATAAQVNLYDNSGPATVNLDNLYTPSVLLSGNTGADTINIAGSGAMVSVASGSGAVDVDAPGDTGRVEVVVADGVTGPVTADIDGHTTTLADGFEYVFDGGNLIDTWAL